MRPPAILWEHSMERYLAARVAEAKYDETDLFPALNIQEAGGARCPDVVIDHADALTAERSKAGEALILTPTNHAGNILFKLAYGLWVTDGCCGLPDEWHDAIFADLRRIGALQLEGGLV